VVPSLMPRHQQEIERMIRRQPGRKVGAAFPHQPLASRFPHVIGRVGDPLGRLVRLQPLGFESADPNDILGLGVGQEVAPSRPAPLPRLDPRRPSRRRRWRWYRPADGSGLDRHRASYDDSHGTGILLPADPDSYILLSMTYISPACRNPCDMARPRPDHWRAFLSPWRHVACRSHVARGAWEPLENGGNARYPLRQAAA
jgi:hypothetical protein